MPVATAIVCGALFLDIDLFSRRGIARAPDYFGNRARARWTLAVARR
jgi:hypothetical protein